MDGDIHSRYLKACKKVGLEPISCVLDACKTGTGTLSLSGNCLSIDTCKILAKILLSGHQFCELDLSDCLIGDEGLTKLMNFLKEDTQLTCVILKSNSIRTQGTAAIADALKRNTTLQRLSLEWNNVGVQERNMKQLCEALIVNPSLCSLDLRSNHIDHMGAAHLANMIQLNSSLQELDLRWNRLGVLGGRKLLSALKGNSSLVLLRVEGNSISSDITEAINVSMSLRLSQHVMEAQHQAQTKELSTQLSQLHSDAQNSVMQVLGTLDSEREAFLQNSQLARCEIDDLKVHLEERDTTIARLETKLFEVQDILRDSLANAETLTADLKQITTQALSNESIYKEKIRDLQKEILSAEQKMKTACVEASNRDSNADAKLHSLELELAAREEKMAAAQRQHDMLRQDLMAKTAELEANVCEREEKCKEQVAQTLLAHQNQMVTYEEQWTGKEAALIKKVKLNEDNCLQLEEEVRVLKQRAVEERGHVLEETGQLQQSLKLQTMKTNHLEDQLEELRTSHKSSEEELHRNISKNKSDKVMLEEELSKLQYKIKEKELEHESERRELAHSKKHQKDMLADVETLHNEIKHLKKSVEEGRKCRRESERKSEGQVSLLKDERDILKRKIEQQRQTIQKFQQEEQQRMSELRAAFNTYMNRVPSKSADII